MKGLAIGALLSLCIASAVSALDIPSLSKTAAADGASGAAAGRVGGLLQRLDELKASVGADSALVNDSANLLRAVGAEWPAMKEFEKGNATLNDQLRKAKGAAGKQAVREKLAQAEQKFYSDAKNQAALAKLPVSAGQAKQAADLVARLKSASGSVPALTEECARLATEVAALKPADVKAEAADPMQAAKTINAVVGAPAALKALKSELATAGGRMTVLSKALGLLGSAK